MDLIQISAIYSNRFATFGFPGPERYPYRENGTNFRK